MEMTRLINGKVNRYDRRLMRGVLVL